mmetsp:Transcript_38780/g.123190  ORF Transcript_38780/g.123190 Transcript_38780/m.123190 type:complete len:227 (-) Transcript_38780:3441-4121(-)
MKVIIIAMTPIRALHFWPTMFFMSRDSAVISTLALTAAAAWLIMPAIRPIMLRRWVAATVLAAARNLFREAGRGPRTPGAGPAAFTSRLAMSSRRAGGAPMLVRILGGAGGLSGSSLLLLAPTSSVFSLTPTLNPSSSSSSGAGGAGAGAGARALSSPPTQIDVSASSAFSGGGGGAGGGGAGGGAAPPPRSSALPPPFPGRGEVAPSPPSPSRTSPRLSVTVKGW